MSKLKTWFKAGESLRPKQDCKSRAPLSVKNELYVNSLTVFRQRFNFDTIKQNFIYFWNIFYPNGSLIWQAVGNEKNCWLKDS